MLAAVWGLSHIWGPSGRVSRVKQEFHCRWWIRRHIKMYYGCNFSPWLIVAVLGCFSWFLTVYTTQNPCSPPDTSTAKKPPQVLDVQALLPFSTPFLRLSRCSSPVLQKQPFLSILLLLQSLPPSSQPLCGYWMSFVCVWMSSLEKDVPQLHIVFHLPAWTETWTMHPDAFQQNRLDVRPCSRILLQFLKLCFQSSESLSKLGKDWKYCIQQVGKVGRNDTKQSTSSTTATSSAYMLNAGHLNEIYLHPPIVVPQTLAKIKAILNSKYIFWGWNTHSFKEGKAGLPTRQNRKSVLFDNLNNFNVFGNLAPVKYNIYKMDPA